MTSLRRGLAVGMYEGIVEATDLPVNADFQFGDGATPDAAATSGDPRDPF